MKNKSLCVKCNDYKDYYLVENLRGVKYKNTIIHYMELRAYCCDCDSEVDVSDLWDENLTRIQEVYSRVKDYKKEKLGENL